MVLQQVPTHLVAENTVLQVRRLKSSWVGKPVFLLVALEGMFPCFF